MTSRQQRRSLLRRAAVRRHRMACCACMRGAVRERFLSTLVCAALLFVLFASRLLYLRTIHLFQHFARILSPESPRCRARFINAVCALSRGARACCAAYLRASSVAEHKSLATPHTDTLPAAPLYTCLRALCYHAIISGACAHIAHQRRRTRRLSCMFQINALLCVRAQRVRCLHACGAFLATYAPLPPRRRVRSRVRRATAHNSALPWHSRAAHRVDVSTRFRAGGWR